MSTALPGLPAAPGAAAGAPAAAPEGQLFDLGYRRYHGPREGRRRALRALYVNGVRTCFGLGRGARAKILPLLFLAATLAPAAVLAAIAGWFGEFLTELIDLPGPENYYAIVAPILLLFAAIIAPELLCPDRRDGVLTLYLVRPLSTNDYLLGRWLAFFSVSLVFIYGGQLLLLTGLVLGADQPLDYLRDNWLQIPRFLGAGLAIAVVTTTIPLAAAAFTTRRAYASLVVIGLNFVSRTAAALLTVVDCGSLDGAAAECSAQLGAVGRWARLIDFGGIPVQVSDLIFGTYETTLLSGARLPPAAAVLWWAVVAAVPAFLLWNRYRKLAA